MKRVPMRVQKRQLRRRLTFWVRFCRMIIGSHKRWHPGNAPMVEWARGLLYAIRYKTLLYIGDLSTAEEWKATSTALSLGHIYEEGGNGVVYYTIRRDRIMPPAIEIRSETSPKAWICVEKTMSWAATKPVAEGL